jgi:hypothetical protein
MKRAFQTLVLMMASLVAVQPLAAQEPCAPGSCPTDQCATGCCADMGGMGAQAMAASCHSAQTMIAMNSTESQHRCDLSTSRTVTPVATSVKLKMAVGSQAVAMATATVEPMRGPIDTPRSMAKGGKPHRYLLLHSFRI